MNKSHVFRLHLAQQSPLGGRGYAPALRSACPYTPARPSAIKLRGGHGGN